MLPTVRPAITSDAASLYQRLLALSRAAVRLQEAHTPDAVIAALGAELGAIGLNWHYSEYDAASERLAIRAVSLRPAILTAAERLLGVRAIGLRLPIDQVTVLRAAIRERHAAFVESVPAIRELFPWLPAPLTGRLCALIGANAFITAPLLVRDRVLGALTVWTNDLSRNDLPAIVVFAQQAAAALDNARLYAAERAARASAESAVQQRDDFLSVAAHELKTPVTSMRGFTQLLARRLSRDATLDPERTRQMLEQINRQSGKLAQLVDQLLDLSRLEAGRLRIDVTEVDVAGLVREAVDAIRPRAQHRAISVHVPGRLMASIDPLRIEQVLINLLDNALKYTPDTTTIDICMGRADGGLRIGVRDHGPGIPPEHRAAIFERFYRAAGNSRAQGLGLGLYLSRQIAELHGGRLNVEFPDDDGTRFVLTIPERKIERAGPI